MQRNGVVVLAVGRILFVTILKVSRADSECAFMRSKYVKVAILKIHDCFRVFLLAGSFSSICILKMCFLR